MTRTQPDAESCRMPTLRAPPAAVLFVHDVERMAAFYRGVFGMRAVLTEPDIAVLELDGFQLTIHRIRGAGTDFRTREDCYVKLCFPVDDLAATRERAAMLGGELWAASHEWDAGARGFRACDGRDPEGNVFQARATQGELPPTA